ncbi:hypothetical protein ACQEVF_58055 [Nonomuraea polychroma]|uniref:hypothetical protein n=1 Tax=Nonomuraea polychroma TaxID=46176 RepID=UPI003D8D9A3F
MDTTTSTTPAPAPATEAPHLQIPELAVEVIDALPVEAVRLLIGDHLIGLAEIGELCGHTGSGTVSGWVKREPELAACRIASFKAGPVFWAPAVRAYLESKGRIPQQGGSCAEPASPSGSQPAAERVPADSSAAEVASPEEAPTDEAPNPEGPNAEGVGEPGQAEEGSPAEPATTQDTPESESQPEPEAEPDQVTQPEALQEAEPPAAKRPRRRRTA